MTDQWKVIKFSGLTVGTQFDLIPAGVEAYLNKSENSRLAIVCSARSGDNHSKNGTTTRLLKAAECAKNQELNTSLQLVEAILNEHIEQVELHIKNPEIQHETIDLLRSSTSQLQVVLEALEVIGELSSNTLDVVLAFGEKLSCILVQGILKQSKFSVKYINLEKCLDRKQYNENLDNFNWLINIKSHLKNVILNQLGEFEIPIITGFFGPFPDGLMNSLGRGYSDVLASLVSLAFDAKDLIAFKTVEGIFTADLTRVPNAKLLEHITPEEAKELTYYGGEVVHPLAIELAQTQSVAITIKNLSNFNGSGTVVCAYPEDQPKPPSPTALTIKEGVTILTLHSNRKQPSHRFFSDVFKTLNRHKIIVDLISTSEVHLSLAISASKKNSYENSFDSLIKDLEEISSVTKIENLAILSLVGSFMKQKRGMAKMMFESLAEAGVNLEMISQGSSEINISCVISQESCDTALNAVHQNLILSSPTSP